MKNYINNAYTNIVSSLKAPPKEDQFQKTGMLSPEEFVRAGDKLIQIAPDWQWQKAPNKNQMYQYLPEDKQFLVCKDCRSSERLSEMMKRTLVFDEEIFGEKDQEQNEDEFVIQNEAKTQEKYKQLEQELEKLALESKEKNEQLSLNQERIYTLYVSYDGYYYCPRLFLDAIIESEDENLHGQPVKPEKIFEDIVAEKVNTTVTIEKHPILGQNLATIHPCKHAEVLKRFSDQIREGRGQDSVGSHLALLMFLKFFHDVIPTIQFDSNFELDLGN